MSDDEELRHLFKQMRAAGLHPLLCDTAVPLVEVPVLAGSPAEAGDISDANYVMLPRKLVGRHPVFLIDAEGLSMRDAGIMPGDRLEVQMGTDFSDGDVVVAEVNGAFTVKTLFRDDEGVMWLVPQNSDFDPIQLTGTIWRIIGKVIGLRKGIPHTPYGDCAKAVQRLRSRQADINGRPLGPRSLATSGTQKTDLGNQPENLVFKSFYNRQRIDFAAIRKKTERVIVMQMKHRYEWYAAYRVMRDLHLLDELKLTKFTQQMQTWFPNVPLQCTSDSLGVYATGHTSKAFALWDSEQFRKEMRKGQTENGFNILFHRCEELRATLFPLPTIELSLSY